MLGRSPMREPTKSLFVAILALSWPFETSQLLADPAQEGQVVPPGDVRSPFGFYSVVFYYAPEPKADPLTTAQAMAKSYFPDLVFLAKPSESEKPPFLGFEQENSPLKNYPVPDASYFSHAGRGLTEDDIASMQKTHVATLLVLVAPKDQVWTFGRRFTELVQEFAEITGASIWDSATRECFSREAWKATRLDSWPENGLPDLSKQITIHLYRNDETTRYLRAITLGMEKFALPDVIIEKLIGSDNQPGGNLINLVCQSLAERPQLESGEKEIFRLEALKEKNFREGLQSSLKDGATGKIPLKLLHGKPSSGDPNNSLIEIRFDHGEGKTEDEQRESLLSKLWGASDSIVEVTHTDEIQEASKRARERLGEIKKDFDQGLPPGSRLLVKAPFARDDSGKEWMWVEVMNWPTPTVITGILQNDPFYVGKLKAGANVEVSVEQIFDYIFYREDGTKEGNETGRLMEKQGGEVKVK